jgi:hypothetical protein
MSRPGVILPVPPRLKRLDLTEEQALNAKD